MALDKSKIMQDIKSFPSMPGTAIKLLSMIEDPNTDVGKIEEVLRFDPGLTANILKLTNSAYFGLPCTVGSVRQAIVLLGLKRLTQLILASCVNAILDKPVPGYDLPIGEMWRHSIAVSIAAEDLVRELKLPESPEIFTAALLHDLGKIVLGGYVKDELNAIEEIISEEVSFIQAERMILGTDHAEIGSIILTSWSFPQDVVDAVRWHHNPDEVEKKSVLIDVVHLANVLCLMIGIGVGREGLLYIPSPEVTKRLKIKTTHLEAVASRTLEWVNDFIERLSSKNV